MNRKPPPEYSFQWVEKIEEDPLQPGAVLLEPDKIGKRLAGLLGINDDLRLAQNLFSLAIDNPKTPFPSVLWQWRSGAWVAGVVLYAKCFTKSEGRKSLNRRDIKTLRNNDFGQAHDELMEIRNNRLAHAGKGALVESEVYLVPCLGYRGPGVQSMAIEVRGRRSTLVPSVERLRVYVALIDALLGIVRDMAKKATDALCRKLSETEPEFVQSVFDKVRR